MRVTVRLFGRLRELAGAGALSREADADATVREIWESLAREFPAFGPYATSVSSAVNADYVRMDATLKDGDEVAFLPPVSGG